MQPSPGSNKYLKKNNVRPPQPYPSWTWNGEIWKAPVPYPEGEGFYTWDEDVLDWILVDVQ